MKTTKKILSAILFILITVILIIGIGIVDNADKTAQNNPFLNGIYIDTDNYILWFRYLGLKMNFSYDFSAIKDFFLPYFKIIYLTALIIVNKLICFLESIV